MKGPIKLPMSIRIQKIPNSNNFVVGLASLYFYKAQRPDKQSNQLVDQHQVAIPMTGIIEMQIRAQN